VTDPDLARQANELARSVDQLSTSVDALAASQRRVKHAVAGIIGVVALVVILSAVVVFVAADAREASRRAEQANSLAVKNAQAAKVTCESGNEARRVSRQMWTYVLDLSTSTGKLTAEQYRQVRTFRAYLATVYADRDCGSPDPTPRPTTPTPTR
jgi:methyl-accepting chemotaxis protein